MPKTKYLAVIAGSREKYIFQNKNPAMESLE
jgi:hypothetical protein